MTAKNALGKASTERTTANTWKSKSKTLKGIQTYYTIVVSILLYNYTYVTAPSGFYEYCV